jgi:hypothetical protein
LCRSSMIMNTAWVSAGYEGMLNHTLLHTSMGSPRLVPVPCISKTSMALGKVSLNFRAVLMTCC